MAKLTRNNGHGNADRPAVGHEFNVVIGLKAQLRDDHIRAGVHFRLQTVQIMFLALGLWMRHRIAGDDDGKVVAILRANESHQIGRVGKVVDLTVLCAGE